MSPNKTISKHNTPTIFCQISQSVNSRPPTLILRITAPLHWHRSQLPTASQNPTPTLWLLHVSIRSLFIITHESNRLRYGHRSPFSNLISLSAMCCDRGSAFLIYLFIFNFHEISLFSLSLISPWSLASFSWIELW